MPNTLAHIGVQGLLTRTGTPEADPKWIYLGCVVPDIPWILQRALYFIEPGIDPYILRSYMIIQASLFFSLTLCIALALILKNSWIIFFTLGSNVFLHLLLDACQTKWANGVNFMVPFSWEIINWGLFWPESLITYILTILGLAYIFWQGRLNVNKEVEFTLSRFLCTMGAVILIASYFLLPFFFLEEPKEADNHYLRTLSQSEGRAGHYVEFDRARYVSTPKGEFLNYYGSEWVPVAPLRFQAPVTVSIRGIFATDNKVKVIESHRHSESLRDYASYLGLGLILAIWIMAWRKGKLSLEYFKK